MLVNIRSLNRNKNCSHHNIHNSPLAISSLSAYSQIGTHNNALMYNFIVVYMLIQWPQYIIFPSLFGMFFDLRMIWFKGFSGPRKWTPWIKTEVGTHFGPLESYAGVQSWTSTIWITSETPRNRQKVKWRKCASYYSLNLYLFLVEFIFIQTVFIKTRTNC